MYDSLLLFFVYTAIVLRPRRRGVAIAAMATITLLATACERPALQQRVQAPPPPQPDRENIARYNRGTKLLAYDSLQAAMVHLDSALVNSKDSVVVFRSAFNSGWDYLVNGKRADLAIKGGGPKAAAMLAMIEKDTAFSANRTVHRNVTGPLSWEEQIALAKDYITSELDSAQAKYRAALVLNPKDADAKWNYELALYVSKEAKGGDKDNKTKPSKQPTPSKKGEAGLDNMPKQKKGKTDQSPDIQAMRLQRQRAEQLLNSMGRHEQQAAKTVPVPVTPPPQGKDW